MSTIHFKHPTAAQWTCTHSTTCTTRHGTSWGHLRSLSVLNRANKSTSSLYASIAWYPITLFLYRVASPCTVVIVLFIYLCHFLVPDRTNIISQWCSKICGRLYWPFLFQVKYTALHRASSQGHTEVIEFLIDKHCNIDIQDEVHTLSSCLYSVTPIKSQTMRPESWSFLNELLTVNICFKMFSNLQSVTVR